MLSEQFEIMVNYRRSALVIICKEGIILRSLHIKFSVTDIKLLLSPQSEKVELIPVVSELRLNVTCSLQPDNNAAMTSS